MKTRKIMAALLSFAAVISFVGCDKKTANGDESAGSALQGESVAADEGIESDGQSSTEISAYYLGIGLDRESHWKMTEEDKQSADDSKYIKNKTSEYDSHGNLLSSDEDTYKYTYNGDGTVKEIARSGSRECIYRYKYDSDKRISQISTLNASGKEEDVLKFTYNKSGKLILAQNGSQKAVFSYDGNGRLIKKDVTDSDGHTVSDIFEYNDRGELIRATISQDKYGMVNLTEEYQYDENGALTKKVSKNFRGMTEEYEYKNDEHGNPIEIKYTEKEHDEISYSSTETYSYEYGAKKIVAMGKTGRGVVKRTYEYQKSQCVITPESDIF